MAINQSCYGVQGAKGVGDYFVYFSVLHALGELRQRTHGSVFDTITRRTFETFNRSLPPQELMDAFETVVAPYMDAIRIHRFEDELLAAARRNLLPRVISGQLRLAV